MPWLCLNKQQSFFDQFPQDHINLRATVHAGSTNWMLLSVEPGLRVEAVGGEEGVRRQGCRTLLKPCLVERKVVDGVRQLAVIAGRHRSRAEVGSTGAPARPAPSFSGCA